MLSKKIKRDNVKDVLLIILPYEGRGHLERLYNARESIHTDDNCDYELTFTEHFEVYEPDTPFGIDDETDYQKQENLRACIRKARDFVDERNSERKLVCVAFPTVESIQITTIDGYYVEMKLVLQVWEQ